MALIKRIVSSLARANPDHIVYGYNEDLTVSDLPRARAVHYRVNNLLNVAVRYDHHQLNFWEQVYLVLSSPVYLCKSFLPAPTFHLCDRHAMMSDLIERVFHYVKLGGPHYCDYFLHMYLGSSLGSICVTSAPPCAVLTSRCCKRPRRESPNQALAFPLLNLHASQLLNLSL